MQGASGGVVGVEGVAAEAQLSSEAAGRVWTWPPDVRTSSPFGPRAQAMSLSATVVCVGHVHVQLSGLFGGDLESVFDMIVSTIPPVLCKCEIRGGGRAHSLIAA